MVGRWGALVVMHGRSRMTIDPRIPTMPGRIARRASTEAQADIACLHQARSTAVTCLETRMKGELHPIKNRLRAGGLWRLVRTFLLMDDGLSLIHI